MPRPQGTRWPLRTATEPRPSIPFRGAGTGGSDAWPVTEPAASDRLTEPRASASGTGTPPGTECAQSDRLTEPRPGGSDHGTHPGTAPAESDAVTVPLASASGTRKTFSCTLLALVFTGCALTGCGYIGDTQPPALNRPELVRDLAAVERGSNIVIQFTIPKVTTEGLTIKNEKDRDIELRVGPPPDPFNLQTWERTSDRIPVAQNKPVAHVEVPASKYYNKTVDIAVNVQGPGGRTMGWSMFVILPVVPALPTPENLTPSDTPDAIHLEWRAMAPEFRIFRKLPADVNWMQIATSTTPSYTDGMIDYGKTYQYMLQSVRKIDSTYAESELSDVKTFTPTDKFPPAVPAGVSAVPGTRSIELVWNRSTEKDFAGYRIYRDGKQIADGVTAPSYSDRDVQPRMKYSYQISAVDTAGNESAKSAAVDAIIP